MPDNLKICFLNHDLSNKTGAGRFFISLIGALKKETANLEYRVLTHDNFLPKSMRGTIFALPKMRKIFKRYEIIHALDGWPYGFIAAVASLGLKKKLIITAVGTGGVKPLYNWWKRPLLKWAYQKAGLVVAVSNNTKREIQKFLPNLNIEVINHGVDYEKFEARNDRSSDFEHSKPYILSIGSWKARKGFEYSIKAFQHIKEKFPDLKYVIASNPPEGEKKKYKDVIFLDNLPEEELIALYKNAELFILLSQDSNKDIEGFGLVFLEAAAAGLPVIGTKESSAEDAILNKKNGFLVEPKNSKEAAEKISEILSDNKLREYFSKNSLEFAKSMNWGKAAQRYKAIYESLFRQV